MTSSRTVTQTQQPERRQRAYSISLVAALPSKISLDTLPPEILLRVLRYALPQPSRRHHKKVDLSSLAVVNRALHAACATLIYRTVALHTTKALTLFARTTVTHPALVASHVRAFAFVSDKPISADLRQVLAIAIRACANLHTLVVPAGALPGLSLPPAPYALPLPAPKHVTLSGWNSTAKLMYTSSSSSSAPTYPTDLFRETTHLSIAGTPAVWTRPREILSALGDPARMTHLCLARRTGGNADNDAEFVADVSAIRERVARVVVSMCPNPHHFASSIQVLHAFDDPAYADADGAGADFAGVMEGMGVRVREGDGEEWRAPWMDIEIGAHGTGLEERYWRC